MRKTGRLGVASLSRVLACSFQPNLTSMTNQLNRQEHFTKFGNTSKPMGIPRIPRLDVRPITVLHETPHVMVAGRNYCNGFSNNQFLLVNKETKNCIFVDACDDWPDDWVAFVSASGLTPTHIFLTHCHVDNIISLNAFLAMFEQHMHCRLGIMWNPAEQCWVDAFPRACERYGRTEELVQPLPLLQNSAYSYYTYAHQLQQRERLLQQHHKARQDSAARQRQAERSPLGSSKGDGADEDAEKRPLPPQLIRHKDFLLTSATNRSTSFYEFGNHNLLFYHFTPGHSPGHMMLSLPRERLLFTGDLLFYNKVGRVDLPWGAGERLAESLLSLEDYPDNSVVLPGHGRMTTLGRERRENRALRTLYESRELGRQEVSIGFNDGYL